MLTAVSVISAQCNRLPFPFLHEAKLLSVAAHIWTLRVFGRALAPLDHRYSYKLSEKVAEDFFLATLGVLLKIVFCSRVICTQKSAWKGCLEGMYSASKFLIF